MIKICSAITGDDTTCVKLESHLIGLDGNRDWLLLNSSLQLSWVVWEDIDISCDFTNLFSSFDLTCSAYSGVWVVGFSHEWVLNDVLEGAVHKTTIAA